MDFWRFLADGKSLFLPEELDRPDVNSTRERNRATEHEFCGTSTYSYESNAEVPGNSELGFHNAVGGSGKAYSGDQRKAALGVQTGTHSYDEVGCPSSQSIARQIQSEQFETGVDLKLGRLPDATMVPRSIGFSNESQHMGSSSSMPSLPAKRTRMTGMSSQSPFCQVEGCCRDLSSFKDYYKRHRVCDAHTKTATVVVNGIQQRFCQQCSRFHLLAEFDDVKRSCRKRLANHNERRRKPHGVKFSPSSLGASFLFQEMLPPSSSSATFGNHESGKRMNGPVKFKEPTNQCPTSFLDFSCSGKGSDNVALEAVVGDKMVKFDQFSGSGSTSLNPSSGVPKSSTCALSLLSSELYDTSNTNLLGASSMSSQKHFFSTQGLTQSPSSSERSGAAASYENQVDCSFMGRNNEESSVVDLYQLSSHLKRVERNRDLGQQ